MQVPYARRLLNPSSEIDELPEAIGEPDDEHGDADADDDAPRESVEERHCVGGGGGGFGVGAHGTSITWFADGMIGSP